MVDHLNEQNGLPTLRTRDTQRRAQGLNPFTPLRCDNLPGNGAVLKRLVLEFAERTDPPLRRRIEENVPFPSTMVDRITPASTDETYADAERLTGHADRAAIETEPFSQWVIEDRLVDGRPAWEKAGALMVSDVSAYEKMKLPQRLLLPAVETLARGEEAETFAIAVAGWMRYAMGTDRDGNSYDLRDPRSAEITTLLKTVDKDGSSVSRALISLPGLFPDSLASHAGWKATVESALQRLISESRLRV